jgi:hypothetical protein
MRTSLKLDGKGQYLARAEDPPSTEFSIYNEDDYNDGVYNLRQFYLHIGNLWTLGFWAKPRPYKEHTTIFSTGARGGKNEIRISTTPVSEERTAFGKSPSEMRVLIKDKNGTTIKHYSWPDWFREEEWLHTTIEWDGTALEAFRAGVPVTTGVTFVDASGTMSDSRRKVFYGSAVSGDRATFSGTVGHFGMWDSLVAPGELGTVVSGGFAADLTVTSGTYTSVGTLQHYWRPGDDPTNIGKDFTVSGTARDLTKERNVGIDNIVLDEPT